MRLDAANPDGLHKTVMRLFPMNAGFEARRVHGVLHRLEESGEGQLMLMIQSRVKPNPTNLLPGYLSENPCIRDVSGERQAIGAGNRFLFRLKANTTKKIRTKTGSDGRRSNGQRVPVRGDAARLEWLGRHASRSGFIFSNVRAREVQARGQTIRVAGVVFDGVLEVTDAGAFRATLEQGIGPAKAYGFGLLSIRRSI